jgi:hypothetical protein
VTHLKRFLAHVFTSIACLAIVGPSFFARPRSEGAALLDPAVEQAVAAERVYDAWAAEFLSGRESTWGVYLWSRRWMNAQSLMNRTTAKKLATAQAHLDRMTALERETMPSVAVRRSGLQSYLAVEFYSAEAESFILRLECDKRGDRAKVAATKQLAAAILMYDSWWQQLDLSKKASSLFNGLYWSARLLEAGDALAANKSGTKANADEFLQRAIEFEKFAISFSGDPRYPEHFLHAARFYRLDAGILASNRMGDLRPNAGLAADALKERLKAAQEAYAASWKGGTWFSDVEYTYQYSLWWRSAALALATTREERIAACAAHLSRMKDMERIVRKAYSEARIGERSYFATKYYRAEAQVLLRQSNE